MLLETSDDLAHWAWYAGAYQQYHSILFLLPELASSPTSPLSPRIWRLTTYIFGPLPPHIPHSESAHEILCLISSKLSLFGYPHHGRPKPPTPTPSMPSQFPSPASSRHTPTPIEIHAPIPREQHQRHGQQQYNPFSVPPAPNSSPDLMVTAPGSQLQFGGVPSQPAPASWVLSSQNQAVVGGGDMQWVCHSAGEEEDTFGYGARADGVY